MDNVITWPMPLTEKPFHLYEVSANGVNIPVWSARVREEINCPDGVGWTHMLNGRTEWAGFARFDFDGSVEVVVKVARDFDRADVLPRSAGVKPAVNGREIRFTMSEPRPLTVILDGADSEPLHFFTHRPERDAPSPDDPSVVYFGPGEHWVNTIELKSGQTLYVHPEALVRAVLPAGARGVRGGVLNLFNYNGAVVKARGASNVAIRGRGIIDGTQMPHPSYNLVSLVDSRDVRVEGVILRNSPNWHLPITNCDGVEVDGLCCISGRLNSDGVNCVNSSRVRVHDTFVRTHDDSFAVKTTRGGAPSQCIRYERCVAWNDWGYAFGVTYETRSDISDVRYSRCDALFSRHWGIGVHAADGGTVSGILFEDISLEYPRTSLAGREGRVIVKIDNDKDCWSTDDRTGTVRDVAVRGLTVNGDLEPVVEIRGSDADHETSGILLEGVVVNGAPLSEDAIRRNGHVRGLVVR